MKWWNKKVNNFIDRISWQTYRIIEREMFWKMMSDIDVDKFQEILNEKKKQGVQYVNLAEMYIQEMRERYKKITKF